MFAPGAVLLDVEHLEAAELEHQDAHQEQGEERAPGAILDEAATNVLDAVGAKEPVDPHQAEDTQDLQLLDREAGEQVGPAEPAEEVAGLRLGREQAVHEIDQEDEAEKRVHHPQHRGQVRVLDRVQQDEVHDRQEREDADEDLVPSVLELLAPRPPRPCPSSLFVSWRRDIRSDTRGAKTSGRSASGGRRALASRRVGPERLCVVIPQRTPNC